MHIQNISLDGILITGNAGYVQNLLTLILFTQYEKKNNVHLYHSNRISKALNNSEKNACSDTQFLPVAVITQLFYVLFRKIPE